MDHRAKAPSSLPANPPRLPEQDVQEGVRIGETTAVDISDNIATADLGFVSLYHHDGRFVRREGVFAFGRRDADGGHTVLHLERAVDISRVATPGHPSWDWAVSNGMNELLVSVRASDIDASTISGADLRFALCPGQEPSMEPLAA